MTSRHLLLAAILLAPAIATAQDPAPAAATTTPPAMPPAPDLSAAPPAAPSPAAQAVAPVPAPAPAEPAAPGQKHGIFPLWGDAVRAKGFELPKPYTVMVNYYTQKSDLLLENLQLGFNGGPMRDVSSIIQVPDARATAYALAIRPAIMVFPFLTFYGVFSSGSSSTDVHVVAPGLNVDFTSTATSAIKVLTLGATFQMGYRGWFAVADMNGGVSDVDRLADLVGGNMLSFRLGRSWKLNENGRRIAAWAGTAGQVIEVETKGEVKLAEVLPPGFGDQCSTLPPGQQALCRQLVAQLTDPSATVQYAMDKRPAHVWNYLVGAQFALDREWSFRTEVSFLNGRSSVLIGAEYGFDIY